MVKTENNRVDTTFIGWFLIGFILLLIGVIGLQWGNVFGDPYKDMPLDINVLMKVCALVGAVLLVLTIFAYRTGKQLTAVIFAFSGITLIAFNLDYATYANSNWFLFIALAIFFLIIAIYATIAKAPKFVILALLLIALSVFFMGLGWGFDTIGPWNDYEALKATSIVSGIFAFLGFVVSVYLGFAYADPKKVPLI